MDDTSRTLPFTATTSSGHIVEFELALHPETASAEQVGALLEGLLDAISDLIEGCEAVSDGDVLQALSLAMAVRMGVSDLSPATARQLLEDLGNLALEGASSAQQVCAPGHRH